MAKNKHRDTKGDAPDEVTVSERKIAGLRTRDAAFGALALAGVGAAVAALVFGRRRTEPNHAEPQADAMRASDAQVEAMLADDAAIDDEAQADEIDSAAVEALAPLQGIPTASFAAADADTFTDATGGGARAPGDFRPDIDAAVAEIDRAGFAPAKLAVPPRSVTMGNGDET